MPKKRVTEVVRVKRQVDFFGIADTDSARPRSFNEIAIKDRRILSNQRQGFLANAIRQCGFRTITEVTPHGLDLLGSVPFQYLGEHRLAQRPNSRHTRTRPVLVRIEHIVSKPLAAQMFRHDRQVDALNAAPLEFTETMTFDAAERLVADHLPPLSLDVFFGDFEGG